MRVSSVFLEETEPAESDSWRAFIPRFSSMGNYLFNADKHGDSSPVGRRRRESSDHDFGRDILPLLLNEKKSTPTISLKSRAID